MPNLPNQQSRSPNHLSSEKTEHFAGNCWDIGQVDLNHQPQQEPAEEVVG
jgi:hypothetical protein